MFLLYLSVCRLQERQPVGLQINSNAFPLHSALLVPEDAWALSDSGEGQLQERAPSVKAVHTWSLTYNNMPPLNVRDLHGSVSSAFHGARIS